MGEHEGHRQRMRERYCTSGLDGFADHEVLELVLFDCIPQGNVNPLAHRLLETFGSFHGVLEAQVEQLKAVPGVGERTAVRLSMLLPLFRRYTRSLCSERRRLSNRAEAADYCLSLLAGWRTERFYLLSLNAEMALVGVRLIAEGSLTEVSAYPRLVVEAALNHNAHGVVLCHNHPGGTPLPSAEDVQTTLRLQSVLEPLGITLLDHLIVGGSEAYSMAGHGELNSDALESRLPHEAHRLVAADSTGKLLPQKRKHMPRAMEE